MTDIKFIIGCPTAKDTLRYLKTFDKICVVVDDSKLSKRQLTRNITKYLKGIKLLAKGDSKSTLANIVVTLTNCPQDVEFLYNVMQPKEQS